MNRITAMAEQVRNNNGDGYHILRRVCEKKLSDISVARSALDREEQELNDALKKAESPRCTVKEGFAVPDVRCSCGAKAVPMALFDGQDISTFMHCENCCDEVGPLDWPFNEQWAYSEDFEAAGFTTDIG